MGTHVFSQRLMQIHFKRLKRENGPTAAFVMKFEAIAQPMVDNRRHMKHWANVKTTRWDERDKTESHSIEEKLVSRDEC